jgi:hypothetical protein
MWVEKDNPNYNHFAFNCFNYGGVRCLRQRERLGQTNSHLPFIQPVNTAKRSKEKCITLERTKDRPWNGTSNKQHFYIMARLISDNYSYHSTTIRITGSV